LDGADAQRPLLGRKVDWRVVAQAPGEATAKMDSARPLTSPPNTSAPRLVVRHAPEAVGVRYLRAANTAWRTGPKAARDDVPTDIAGLAQPLPRDACCLA